MWNAKLLFAPDLARALAVHRSSGAIATLVLRRLPAGERFRRSRPTRTGACGASAANRAITRRRGAATHVHGRADPERARAPRLAGDGDIFEHAYIPWLARGEHIASVTDDAPWFDVGVTPVHYLEANMALASGALRWPGIVPDAHGVIAGSTTLLPAGVQPEQCVLGDDVSIDPATSLKRVVAWSGATLRGPLENAIVTTEGTVLRIA